MTYITPSEQWTFDQDTRYGVYIFLHEFGHACGLDHVPQTEHPIPYAVINIPVPKYCNNVWVCCFNNVILKKGKGVDCAKKINH